MGRTVSRREVVLMSGLLLLLTAGPSTGWAKPGAVPEAFKVRAARDGEIRVIVQFTLPTVPAASDGAREMRIQNAQDDLEAKLQGTQHRVIRKFTKLPFIGLVVGPTALHVLEQDPSVESVELDDPDFRSLETSVPLVEGDLAWMEGFDGSAVVVAILDDGVDSGHPNLAGKVVREACFSDNGSCPNGMRTQFGADAARPCTYSRGCFHGTHVAGIAAGRGARFSGVARGASVVAIQVFSRLTGLSCQGAGEDPCAGSFPSDQVAALDWLLRQTDLDIAAANMSLGGGRYTAPCDDQQAARAAVIRTLRDQNRVATVISSGNNGFPDALSAPACISVAVSVGATDRDDVVRPYSNSAPFLSLLAPGDRITSAVPVRFAPSGFGTASGTSMAAPHVAGAFAILRQAAPDASVDELLAALQDYGLCITDERNGVMTPRIQIYQALIGKTPAGCSVAVPSSHGN